MTQPANGSVSAPRMSLEDTFHAIYDAQLQIAGLLAELPVGGRGESSLEIENMAKGPPKITTKTYGEPLTRAQIDAALEAHAYAHREAERRSMEGWRETVTSLEEAKHAAAEAMREPEQPMPPHAVPPSTHEFEAEHVEEVWRGNVEPDPTPLARLATEQPFGDEEVLPDFGTPDQEQAAVSRRRK